jgi:hypothetical protein
MNRKEVNKNPGFKRPDPPPAPPKTINSIEVKIKENKMKKDIEDLMKEFEELCLPINKWLQTNFDPHAKIIIETDHAEIVKCVISIPSEVVD